MTAPRRPGSPQAHTAAAASTRQRQAKPWQARLPALAKTSQAHTGTTSAAEGRSSNPGAPDSTGKLRDRGICGLDTPDEIRRELRVGQFEEFGKCGLFGA